MNFILGRSKYRSDPDGFATRAASCRDIFKDAVKSLGSTFETWDTKLQNQTLMLQQNQCHSLDVTTSGQSRRREDSSIDKDTILQS